MPKYFLGVDGGQSSTTALIGDETGQVVGQGRGGPCNHVSGDQAREKFRSAVGGCVKMAAEQAGLKLEEIEFEAGCFGFSGGPADKDALIAEMFRLKKRIVTHDAWIALTGAHAGQPGIITIAGTGSIAFARNAEGKFARAGGWGFIFGDEGGGFDLTRQALRAALRMEEGWGPPTLLRQKLLEATGARDANDLLHRFYTPEFPRPRIAELSRLVEQAAEEGDDVAADILVEAAQHLAGLTMAARMQVFTPQDHVRAAPIGGVFRCARLYEEFRQRVQRGGNTTVHAPIYGPAAGALLEAYRAAGLKVALKGAPAEKS